MSEGNTYRSTWWQTASGSYELWVAARPTIRGVGPTAEAAFDDLCRRINADFGDYSPEFDFDPPLPTVPLPAGIDKTHYVSLWSHGGLGLRNPPRTLFNGLDCEVCKYNQPARRTDVPLSADPTADSAIGDVGPHQRDGWCMSLATALIDQLTDAERQAFTQRPIVVPPRSRRKCVEVVPNHLVPVCGVRGVEVTMGVRCEACGFQTFSHGNAIKWLKSVCRSDLPDPIPTLFFVGTFAGYSLCMARSRWLELKRLPGMSKWTSKPLLVVDEANCLRDPPLPSAAERADQKRRTGRPLFSFTWWAKERASR